MEVNYCSTYGDLSRCTFYSLSHRRELLLRMGLPILYGAFAFSHHFAHYGWLKFPVAAFVSAFGMSILLTIIVQLFIFRRLVMPEAQRRCTTILAESGFTDATVRRTQNISWLDVSDIRYHNGDIYFWRKGKDGLFVPRSAFNNGHQSRQFYEEAKTLWNTLRSDQRVVIPQVNSVWPPAPRPGA